MSLFQYQALAYVPLPAPAQNSNAGNGAGSAQVFEWVQGSASSQNVEPISPIYKERSTPDKWKPLDNQPLFDVKRLQYTFQNWCGPIFPTQVPAVGGRGTSPLVLGFKYVAASSRTTDPIVTTPPAVKMDSWWQQPNTPVFDRKRFKYLDDNPNLPLFKLNVIGGTASQTYVLGGRDVVVQGGAANPVVFGSSEIVTVDKWWQQPNLPRYDLKRNQFIFQSSTLPDRQQLPDTDSWLPASLQPQFDLKRTQYTYQSFATADRQQQPRLDSWLPAPNQPPSDVKRLQYLGQWYTWPEFPVQIPAVGGKGATATVLRIRRVVAGSRITEVPVFSTKTVNIDSWWQQPNIPLFDLKRAQFEAQTFTEPERQQLPDADSWLPEIRQPLFDLKRQQYAYQFWHSGPVSTTFPERSTPDKWHPLSNQPLFDQKRQQYTYQTFVSADRQQLPDLDSWLPASLQPQFDLKRQQATYPYLAFTQTAFGEIVYPDKWHPEIQRPRFDLARTQALYPFLAFDPIPFATPIFAGSWHPLIQQPQFDQKRAQFDYSFFVTADTQPQPRSDSWTPNIVQPLYDLKRTQTIYPSLSFTETTFKEVIYVDKWKPLDNQPLFDLKRQQAEYPDQSFDPLPFASPIFADRWVPSIVQPLFDLKRTQALYPAYEIRSVSTTFAERTSVDKWKPLDNQPLFDLKRLQALYPSLTFAPFPFPSPIFAGTWHPAIVQPQFDSKRAQYLYPAYETRPISTTFVERTSLDKWYQLPNQPQFDLKRIQFEAQTFVGPDRQPVPIIISSQDTFRVIANSWRPYPELIVPVVQSVLSLGQWYAEQYNPIFPKHRIRIDGQAFTIVFQRTVSVDSWWQRTQEPIRKLVAALQFDSKFVSLSTTAAVPFVSSWHGQNDLPFRDRYKAIYGAATSDSPFWFGSDSPGLAYVKDSPVWRAGTTDTLFGTAQVSDKPAGKGTVSDI